MAATDVSAGSDPPPTVASQATAASAAVGPADVLSSDQHQSAVPGLHELHSTVSNTEATLTTVSREVRKLKRAHHAQKSERAFDAENATKLLHELKTNIATMDQKHAVAMEKLHKKHAQLNSGITADELRSVIQGALQEMRERHSSSLDKLNEQHSRLELLLQNQAHVLAQQAHDAVLLEAEREQHTHNVEDPQPEDPQPSMHFYYLDADEWRVPYDDAVNELLLDAYKNGVAKKRLPNVPKRGTNLKFEVRFGEHAVSEQMPKPPQSKMCQVNLETGVTRIVVLENKAKLDRWNARAIKNKLERDTLGAVSMRTNLLAWYPYKENNSAVNGGVRFSATTDDGTKCIDVFGTTSIPEIHSLFERFATDNTGLLYKAQMERLLASQLLDIDENDDKAPQFNIHDTLWSMLLDPIHKGRAHRNHHGDAANTVAMKSSAPFWPCEGQADKQTGIDRDRFTCIWHALLKPTATCRKKAKLINWSGTTTKDETSGVEPETNKSSSDGRSLSRPQTKAPQGKGKGKGKGSSDALPPPPPPPPPPKQTREQENCKLQWKELIMKVDRQKRKLEGQTTWKLERTIRVWAFYKADPENPRIRHALEQELKEKIAESILAPIQKEYRAHSSLVKIQARARGVLVRLSNRTSVALERSAIQLQRRKSIRRRREDRSQDKKTEALEILCFSKDGKNAFIDLLVEAIQDVRYRYNDYHDEDAHLYEIVFCDSLSRLSQRPTGALGVPARNSTSSVVDTGNVSARNKRRIIDGSMLTHLLEVESGRDLVNRFFWKKVHRYPIEGKIIRGFEAEAAVLLKSLHRLLITLPKDIEDISFSDIPLGSTGLQMIAARIARGRLDASTRLPSGLKHVDYGHCPRLTKLKKIRFSHARLGDQEIRFDGSGDFCAVGDICIAGLKSFARALACNESVISTVEIRGFITEQGLASFFPSPNNDEEAKLWRRIKYDKAVQFVFDLNSSLTPDTVRLLNHHCSLKQLCATGNSYEGDGLHHMATMLDSQSRDSQADIVKLSCDATRTTDLEVLEILEAALCHEKLEHLTIVWKIATSMDETRLATELLKLNPLYLCENEYYRRHHCIDFAERSRQQKIRQSNFTRRKVGVGLMDKFRNRASENDAQHFDETTQCSAVELTLDKDLLAFPITLALKLFDICNVVAEEAEAERPDMQDRLHEFARNFESIAVRIFDQCPNEYVAERVLRGCKDPRLIDNLDLFRWTLDNARCEPPKHFICSRWFQHYIAKVWTHADLTWDMDDRLYFGSQKIAGSAPCDWTRALTEQRFLYFVDLRATAWCCLHLIVTALLSIFIPFVNTHHVQHDLQSKSCQWALTQGIAELKLFWSVPKVKYTVHMLFYCVFLLALSLLAVGSSNPSRSGDWSIAGVEVWTYSYIMLHCLAEAQAVRKGKSMATNYVGPRGIWENFSFFVFKLKTHVLSSPWNVLDGIMMAVSFPLMGLRLYLLTICEPDPNGDCRVPRTASAVVHPYTDITMWVNVLLALTVLSSWLRAFALLITSKTTGVLIIAIFKMINDILVYVVIQLVLIVGFAFSFVALMANRSLGDDGEHTLQWFAHTTLAIFGYWENDLEPFASGNQLQVDIGHCIFILSQMMNTILLINLLIAMMSHTYDTVQEEAVKGWLVAKALITLDYTDSLHSVMDIPPFNIARIPLGIWRATYGKLKSAAATFRWIQNRVRPMDTRRHLDQYFAEVTKQGAKSTRRYCSDAWLHSNLAAQRAVLEEVEEIIQAQTASNVIRAVPRLDHDDADKDETKVDAEAATVAALSEERLFQQQVVRELQKRREALERLRKDHAAYIHANDIHQAWEVRQICQRPPMIGVSVHQDDDNMSPYHDDYTVERAFVQDNGLLDRQKALHGEFIAAREEKQQEQPATEEDVLRIVDKKFRELKQAITQKRNKWGKDGSNEGNNRSS